MDILNKFYNLDIYVIKKLNDRENSLSKREENKVIKKLFEKQVNIKCKCEQINNLKFYFVVNIFFSNF